MPMQTTTRDTTTRQTENKNNTSTNMRDSGIEDVNKSMGVETLVDSTSGAIGKKSFNASLTANMKQPPKALLYYPEECHMSSIADCKEWNSRLMRHMIGSKMAKNQTY